MALKLKSFCNRAAAFLSLLGIFPLHLVNLLIGYLFAILWLVAVVGLTAAGIVQLLLEGLRALGAPLPVFLSPTLTRPVVFQVSAIMTIGLVSFWIRSRFLLIYGVVEIMVGGILGWVTVNQDSGPAIKGIVPWLTTLGGIYVVVRGLDNFDKALPADNTKWSRNFFDHYVFLRRPTPLNMAPSPVAELWRYVRTGAAPRH